MFYRALAVGIVGFWLLMMALLVRVEFSSGESELLPVPAAYVWKLMFLHDQSSDLVLYSQRQRIGTFHLQPRRLPTGTDGTGGPIHLLTGSGSLTVTLPGTGANAQNVTLRGSLELDEKNAAQRCGLNIGIRTAGQGAPGLNLVLDGQPAHDQWHYQLRSGEEVRQENSGTSAALLDALNLGSFGIDPKALVQAGQQQAAAANVTARRGVLHMNGEDLESYVVSVHHGDLFETTMYVSPLGQILAVKTFGGYDLYDDTLTP